MRRGEHAEAGTFVVTAAAVQCTPAMIVRTITAAAAVSCFQGDNIHEHEDPEGDGKNKRGKIPLVQVLGREGKMKPERIVLDHH